MQRVARSCFVGPRHSGVIGKAAELEKRLCASPPSDVGRSGRDPHHLSQPSRLPFGIIDASLCFQAFGAYIFMASNPKPVSENNPGPDAGRKPDDQASQTKPNIPPSSSLPELPPPKTHCQITCKIENNWWDKVKPIVEILGIILLGVYTFYTIKMYQANNNAAHAARDAADAAKGSFDLARQSFHFEQRAWVSVTIPAIPLNGKYIPATLQMTNTGKTPATGIQGNIVATILAKGERPTFGDYSVGHPHKRLYAAAVFPNSPLPITIAVAEYGPTAEQQIIPDDSLRKDIANGNRFIVFYGEITYSDIFGIKHWTHFCTVTAPAVLDNLTECISYNNIDYNQE
jgi:hypothetical protein